MSDSDMRIVLLGKTGAGKSSLCNTIFGKKLFKKNHGANTERRKCQKATRSVNGKKITVIDTPGLFDTNRSEEELKPEIVKCITECSPGPHAFLILLKVEEFTEEEQAVITKICQYFSEEAFKYAVVVFTHGDQLPKGMKIEEFVSQNEKLSELVEKCGGRCHIFDNKYRKNKLQVTELLNTIKVMVDTGGYYTNEMLQAVERKIQQEEERIRNSSPDMSEEEIREKAKRNVSNLLKTIVGVTTGALLGALLSVPVMIVLVVKAIKKKPIRALVTIEALAAAGQAAAAGVGSAVCTGFAVAAGAGGGGYIGYCAVDEEGSVKEAAKNAAKAVIDEAKNMINKKKQKQSEEKSPLL